MRYASSVQFQFQTLQCTMPPFLSPLLLMGPLVGFPQGPSVMGPPLNQKEKQCDFIGIYDSVEHSLIV